jgi:hypothetical protein
MKCFERMVMAHIISILPDTPDPLQLAYRPNRSTDDTTSIALHTALYTVFGSIAILYSSYDLNTLSLVETPSNLLTQITKRFSFQMGICESSHMRVENCDGTILY